MTINDTENYIKLHLLENKVGTLVLRGLFLKIVKNSSCKEDVDKYLKIFKSNLQKLRNSHHLSQSAFQVLFPDNPNGSDVDEWDLALVSLVLRFCCYNRDTLRELLVHYMNNDFNLETLLQIESDSRKHEITDEQIDKIFPRGGQRSDINAMDRELLVMIVLKGGNSVLRRFNLSMWKFVRTELQLAGSEEDFLNNHLQNKDKIETMLSDKKLPSLHTILKCGPIYELEEPVCCKILIIIAWNIKASIDLETVKAVAIINQMQNDIGQNKAAINKKAFTSKWKQIVYAINTIVQIELPEMTNDVEKMINEINTYSIVAMETELLIKPVLNTHVDEEDTTESESGYGDSTENLSENSKRFYFERFDCWVNAASKIRYVPSIGEVSEITIEGFIETFDINECSKENGRKSAFVKSMCDLISNLLCNCSPKILRVWPAYQPAKEEDIRVVFVAITEDDQIDDIRIPPHLDKFEIKCRNANAFSHEESKIMKCTNCKEKRFTDNELEQVGIVLRKYSKRYMDKHQNLNIMSASPLKSIKFGEKSAEIKHETCVVFYVGVKGFIPLNEDEFPPFLDDFQTDVRESSFELFSPKNYHSTLKMGCLIGSGFDSEGNGISGTLGAFVDLPDGSVGCFTSAHAILHGHLMRDLIKYHLKTYVETIDTQVFQPLPTRDKKHFGHVVQAVYKEGGNGETGLEAALIKITDQSRHPDSAEFPERQCGHGGLAQNSRFKSGKILTKIPKRSKCLTVFKFGAETCLTRGAFKLNGSAVRTSTMTSHERDFGVCLHNQIEMTTVGSHNEVFAKEGDSGAVVLIPHNGDEDDLRAIGIITGGNQQGTIYVTPIVDILRAFGYANIGSLKSFQYSIAPDSELDESLMDTEQYGASAPSGYLFKHNVTGNVSLESFEEFKEDVNKKFQKIDDGQSNLEDGQRNLEGGQRDLEGGQKKTNETLESMHEMLRKLVARETNGE